MGEGQVVWKGEGGRGEGVRGRKETVWHASEHTTSTIIITLCLHLQCVCVQYVALSKSFNLYILSVDVLADKRL